MTHQGRGARSEFSSGQRRTCYPPGVTAAAAGSPSFLTAIPLPLPQAGSLGLDTRCPPPWLASPAVVAAATGGGAGRGSVLVVGVVAVVAAAAAAAAAAGGGIAPLAALAAVPKALVAIWTHIC